MNVLCVCSVESSGTHQRRHQGGCSREDGGGAHEPRRSAARSLPECCRPLPERAGQPAAAKPRGTLKETHSQKVIHKTQTCTVDLKLNHDDVGTVYITAGVLSQSSPLC